MTVARDRESGSPKTPSSPPPAERPAARRRVSAAPPSAPKSKPGFAKPRIAAVPDAWEDELEPPAEWASLLGDLGTVSPVPKWRIHDRTHLEFAVDYARPEVGRESYVWDAYFFIPRSLRVSPATYRKDEIYRDLQSYVRFVVPPVSLAELARIPAERIAPHLDDVHRGVREMRLFACQLRASAIAAKRRLRKLVEKNQHADVHGAAMGLTQQLGTVLEAFRAVIGGATASETQITARWIDEDTSRLVETVLGDLAIELGAQGRDDLAAIVASGAVAEARYRALHGHECVGSADATKRDIEHLEFRRHLLKRFSSSVLWLDRQIAEAGRWTMQALYVIAAAVAMAFAVGAAAYHGTPDNRAFQDLWTWAVIVVLAYAGKDRIKATLQGVFSKWVSKHFPDRRWRLRDRDEGRRIGTVFERSHFVSHQDMPEAVLTVRNSTRMHELEEQARPEYVLWHQKMCRLRADAMREADLRFSSVTEIFRLDLRRWLVHTDDPKQRTVFADPEDQHVYSAMAPRVYNIGVVYRLRKKGDEDAPWHRIRVVISRKGVKRIERIA